jgi:hypothetical protein
METKKAKRKSGIPTGHAGEYLVMGELLRRGYDAQLADRNTRGYDILAGRSSDGNLRKVQVKTVRVQPWYVRMSQFQGDALDLVTVYVLLGSEQCETPVRFFITRNREVMAHAECPADWTETGFMRLKPLLPFEGQWNTILG